MTKLPNIKKRQNWIQFNAKMIIDIPKIIFLQCKLDDLVYFHYKLFDGQMSPPNASYKVWNAPTEVASLCVLFIKKWVYFFSSYVHCTWELVWWVLNQKLSIAVFFKSNMNEYFYVYYFMVCFWMLIVCTTFPCIACCIKFISSSRYYSFIFRKNNQI